MQTIKSIFGIILLCLGAGMILWGLWKSWEIFSGKIDPPQIFYSAQEEQSQASGLFNISESEAMQKMFTEQLSNFLPKNSMAKILNLVSWSIFMTILVFASYRLAFLGIKLMQENHYSSKRGDSL